MAAGDIGPSNPFDFLNSGVNFLSNASDFLLGKSSTTSGNTSGKQSGFQQGFSIQEEDVSLEKANALIQQMLESVNGLSAISGMTRSAGIYDSTVQSQLTNDLASRIAGQVAALSSKKYTTSNVNTFSESSSTATNKQKTPGIIDRILKIF